MTTTKENLANPGPVGLCGFALTTWLLSLINGGFFTAQEGVGLVLGMALAFGGIAQVIAGMFEFKKGNTFGFTAFISYGAFWWTWALFTIFFKGETAPAFIGWYLCAWGMFSLMMFVATLTKPKVLSGIFFCFDTDFLCFRYWRWHGKSQHRPYRRLLRFGNCTWCVLLGSGRSHQRIFRPYGFADWRT